MSELRAAQPRPGGYTRSDWLIMLLAGLTLVPFVVVLFGGVGADSPWIVAAVTGAAIVAAAFFLSWATEGLESILAQSLALALLALIEVAPEYTFEILLAYRRHTELAAASMTGANRLLLGLGWPLIMFVAYLSARRKGRAFTVIQLDQRNVPEILFLLLASLYAFVIVLKGTLALLDSVVLVGIYGLYLYTAFRSARPRPNEVTPGGEDAEVDGEEEDDDVGVGARTKHLPRLQRGIAIGSFLALGAFILYFGAEPFIDGVLEVAREQGVSQFILIQWVAPFLSEFPESLTAFLWAAAVVSAGKGLSNLISSKLNQWTLLIAAIPLAYSVSLGHGATILLTPQSVDEIFLTAAQSLFGLTLLLTLRFGLRAATALLVLFVIQFFIPIEGIRVIIAWLYLALAGGVVLLTWRKIRIFDDLPLPFRKEPHGE